jgi:hypothetical protein
MKTRDVQRSVRAQRHDRNTGDAPSIGRVGRMPGVGQAKGELRKRRRGESPASERARNNRRKVMLMWSTIFVFLTVAVMGTAIWLWLRPKISPAPVVAHETVRKIEERVVSKFESPTEDAALARVKGALSNRDVSKVTEYFRTGSSTPTEVVAFLEAMERTEGKPTGMTWLRSMDANGLLLDGVAVNFQPDSKALTRLAMLTPDANGKWQLDFDAYARVVNPSWSELMEGKVKRGLVRVVVARKHYYNFCFKDDAQWLCYEMTTPDHEVILFGYCRKGSPQAEAMGRIVTDGERLDGGRFGNRATLEIRRNEGSESRQFEITRVLAEDWVLREAAFDGSYQ